ncbi:MAG: heavy metal-binding domain-containing protein, partial [Theionarchaea archaeon]|nr:heavy metal-binding domain-containing protein [Theionarchaea archaeon]
MIVVNTDFVPGKEIVEIVGLVRGNTIRAKHLGKDLMAGLR